MRSSRPGCARRPITIACTRTVGIAAPPDAWSGPFAPSDVVSFRLQQGLGFVHSKVRQTVGFLVHFPADVLQGDVPYAPDQGARLAAQRLEPLFIYSDYPEP